MVAQALAFRSAVNADDVQELTSVITQGYGGEDMGKDEGFRKLPIVDNETVAAMIADTDCKWIVVSLSRT